MRAVCLDKRGNILLKEFAMPEITQPDDVIVRIAYSSICGFDMMMVKGDASRPINGRFGHEASGIIVEVGSAVDPDMLQVNDRVALDFRSVCDTCDDCRNGNSTYCGQAHTTMDFMAEYTIVKPKQLYKLPKDVSLKEGCLSEPVMMCQYGLRKANVPNAGSVLLLGCGAMGSIMLKLAQFSPAAKIVVAEPVASKRELAKRLGAHEVINPADKNAFEAMMEAANGEGFHSVIEISGDQKSARSVFQLVRRGGSCVFFGLYGMNFEIGINLFQLYWKNASIHAVYVPSNGFASAVKLLPRLQIGDVITGLFPYDKCEDAFAAKASGQHAKVMLQWIEDQV